MANITSTDTLKSADRTISYSHVLMPNGAHNLDPDITLEQQQRFNAMQESWAKLKLVIGNTAHQREGVIFEQLGNCLTSYNPKLQEGNFNILKDLCIFIANENCEKFCLLKLLLEIIEMAEDLYTSETILSPIPLLCQNEKNFVRIKKSQAASLLANAFLCAFPKREGGRDNAGPFASYPRINFNELYDDTLNTADTSWRSRTRTAKLEKLKCLMNYFRRCIERRPFSPVDNNDIIFERRVLPPGDLIDWGECNQPLLKMKAFSKGAIEDAENRLQVDFANEFVGGGTLGNGAAMEEICFITCPELIVSAVFTERLNDCEALVVQGFEQFSTYTGYGSSFKFEGDYEQDFNQIHQLVVLDALRFPRNSKGVQYTKQNIDRELNKCLVGFRSQETDHIPPTQIPIVASGKWGCGVFNGDPELKSVLQWIASSVANKGLELYTFGDGDLTYKMNELSQLVQDHEITVGFMYKAVAKFGKGLLQKYGRNRGSGHVQQSLIHFLKLEIVPEEKVKRKYSSSDTSEDEVAERNKVVRPRKIQSRQPEPYSHQLSPALNIGESQASTSTSNLFPANNATSESGWMSKVFCMLQNIIPTFSVKIPKVVLIQICYFLKICKIFMWIFKPGLWIFFGICSFVRQATNKMINFRNPQAVSTPPKGEERFDWEKQELDLSDSD